MEVRPPIDITRAQYCGWLDREKNNGPGFKFVFIEIVSAPTPIFLKFDIYHRSG